MMTLRHSFHLGLLVCSLALFGLPSAATGALACSPDGQTVDRAADPMIGAKDGPPTKPAPGPNKISKRDLAKAEKIFAAGLRLRAKRDNDGAIDHFEKAAALGFVRGWKEIGTTRMKMGQNEAAIDAFETFLEVAPDHEQAPTIRQLVERLKAQR